MAEPQFGFTCNEFSVALSGNDIILPGSKNAPLKKSLLPYTDMNDAAGQYTLRATCDDSVICDLPVHVVWVGHKSQPEPFLGLKVENPEEVREALKACIGKRVELTFTPRDN
jgi:hypothetical protein